MNQAEQFTAAVKKAASYECHRIELMGRMVSVSMPANYHRRLIAMLELHKTKGGDITLSDALAIEESFPDPRASEEE